MEGNNVFTLIFINVCFLFASVHATVTLPSIYNNDMVLQRNETNCIYGTASSSVTLYIEVTNFPSLNYTNTSNLVDGGFEICLPQSLYAEYNFNPFSISISDDDSQVTLNNVVFGEVWWCGGETNMEFPVRDSFDAQLFGTEHRSPLLRTYAIPQRLSTVPLTEMPVSKWNVATSSQYSSFSAICYAYGREIVGKTGVPVGLISATWRGTYINPWLSFSLNPSYVDCPMSWASATDYQRSTVIYNGMVNPYKRFRLRGFLLFFGESGIIKYHGCLLRALISDWRENFKILNAPVGIIPVSPVSTFDGTGESYYDLIRQATYSGIVNIPNVYVTTAIDLGDSFSPFGANAPRNKTLAAQRLARQIGYDYYGFKDTPLVGPTLASCCQSISDNKQTFRLTFETPVIQIATPTCDLCCSDGPFELVAGGRKHTFLSTTYNKENITLVYDTSSSSSPFSQVKYASVNFPQCVLYNPFNPAFLPVIGFNISCSDTCTSNTPTTTPYTPTFPPSPSPSPSQKPDETTTDRQMGISATLSSSCIPVVLLVTLFFVLF